MMIKVIITVLMIACAYAYPFEEESRIRASADGPVPPEIKPLILEADQLPADVPEEPRKPSAEGTDLKTDATFWPYYRSYHWYPYYYRYYTYRPRVYYSYYW